MRLPTRHLVLIAALFLSSALPAQDVLVYSNSNYADLSWYAGYASLNVTLADQTTWMAMSTAQFAAYDMIWIGSNASSSPFTALYSTRTTWAPAVSGRIIAHAFDPSAHGGDPGAQTFADDAAAWLLGGGGTGLYVSTDVGTRGMDFLDPFMITGCMGFNCFGQDVVNVTLPHPAIQNSTTMSLSNWSYTSHNYFTATPAGWLVVAEGPGGEDLCLVKEAGPTCNITAPAAASTVMGVVSFTFDGDDTMMTPIDLAFEWSDDGGTTWNPATAGPASPLPNPAPPMATPFTGAGFDWDSYTDGVGGAMVTPALFRILVDNGSVMSSCSVLLDVDNVAPVPTCTLTSPGGTIMGVASFATDTVSLNSPTVDMVLEFSTDGGATYLPATLDAGSPLPNPAMGVPTGAGSMDWDSRTDGVGLMALFPGAVLRLTIDDGVSLVAGVCTETVDVDNQMVCNGICGDCDLNGQGPDVLDALAGAQISAGLIVPTTVQMACCDVNSSLSVTVLDALGMAQAAAGLMPMLICP